MRQEITFPRTFQSSARYLGLKQIARSLMHLKRRARFAAALVREGPKLFFDVTFRFG